MRNLKLETHRGITTNPNPRFENNFKTKINRFGQKTISLPRIDDKKRWAGFPGITGISKKLAAMIPECRYFVEPFAGTAKVCQELFLQDRWLGYNIQFILNDKSKPISRWLKKEFGKYSDVKITNADFKYCIKKHDSKYTVFVIDPPWFKSYYDQVFSYFDRKTTREYDREIINLCDSIKGKFFITTRKENHTMRNSGFINFTIQSEYVVSGKYPEVLITTNVSKEDLG